MARNGSLFCRIATVLLTAAFVVPAAVRAFAATPTVVWIEGEKPDAINVPYGPQGEKKPGAVGDWGRADWLSGGNWLSVSVDAQNVEKTAPDGVNIQYKFTAPKAGDYAIWNRIGFEFVRSPFSWRIDDGAWQTAKPTDLTTDLVELQTWTEVAWLNLGHQTLSAGAHTLEIKLDRTTDDKGKPQRILYASDALALVTDAPFSPNGKYKPGEEAPRTEPATSFTLGSAPQGRVNLPLNGVWEIARDDETVPGPVAEPIQSLPADPHWTTIAVPGDRNDLRPDLLFAHRIWYRTRVTVPAEDAGRAFVLSFPENNLNTTVYVNGVLCGFEKNPFCHFTVDVTKGIHPGQTNEIWVGIRDAWYGYSFPPSRPQKLRQNFNIPLEFTGHGFQRLAYPIWHGFQSGILATPTLTATGGPAYVADVFCKPSVAQKRMDAEITLTNPTATPVSGELRWEAVNDRTGQVEKTFAPQPFSLAANGSQVLNASGAWADPKLWWPDPKPNLYRLRTTLVIGGKPGDIQETTFGFREWGSQGDQFTLNGVPWHLWADLPSGNDPQTWLANYRRTNTRTMRLMGVAQGSPYWMGKTPDEALDFFDRNGVVVRRCGPLDGEAIGYMAIEEDPELKQLYGSDIKMDLLNNWRDQMVAQVKGERNHPSVAIWSLENEFLYINCINLYAGLMDKFEAQAKLCSDAVRAVDPTRLTMTDGGGANKDQSMPVHGNHYVAGSFPSYPAEAYAANPTGGGRGRWVWDEKRPRFIGEDFFATGINPAEYSALYGESTFVGKAATRPAVARMFRILTQGYRWAGYSAWQLWLGEGNGTPEMYHDQSPIAVFCRQWNWTFGSGQKARRTLGVFNDSHDGSPLTLTRTLTVGAKVIDRQVSTLTVVPGTNQKFDVTLPLPAITAARTSGVWTLALTQQGHEVFRDSHPFALMKVTSPTPESRVALAGNGRALGGVSNTGRLFVYDPQGATEAYLKAHGVAFTPLASLASLPTSGKVLLIGKDALTADDATSPKLAAWASTGRGVIVLEQQNPLRYQGLPAVMEPAHNEGRAAFEEDDSHPVFRNLTDADLFTWGDDEVVYRDAYEKPTGGGKSLVQCDTRLGNTALAEIPVNNGLLLVSQLQIAGTLAQNAVAQQLLTNLVNYASAYKKTVRPVTLAVESGSKLPGVLSTVGITYHAAPADSPLKALSTPGSIAVIAATPQNLKTLAANLPSVRTFNASGGWMILCGLTPDGLADYNKIVGVDHMIRPFRLERVTFPAKKNPLTAGLSTGDIVLSSGRRINGYTEDEYTADDEFSYVVDYDEIASFLNPPDPGYWGLKDASNDHNPLNAVNGYTSQDFWGLAFMIWAADPAKPATYPFDFPKPQEITRIEWTGNPIYQKTAQIRLAFDGGKSVTFDTEPNGEPQTFSLPPGNVGKNIDLQITKWTPSPNPAVKLVGIDNVRLWAKRSPEFYQTVRPMLNVGGMMEYVKGPGGIVLCNVRFQDTEAVPANAARKRNILATILRNLDAPIGSGDSSVIVGAPGLVYTPIDLSKSANQFRTAQGWFGDKNFTFADLPTGKQVLGGVPFQIYDFLTSPVPTVVMLGGNGIPGNLPDAVNGISVGHKADALFFLQTARLDQRRNDQDIRNKKQYEMAKYVIHYADGQTAEAPIYAETSIGDYRQKSPASGLPGASLAWTRPYPGTDQSAAAYLMQWNNPRPGVAIESIDLEYGPDRRGIPALLALTAATAR